VKDTDGTINAVSLPEGNQGSSVLLTIEIPFERKEKDESLENSMQTPEKIQLGKINYFNFITNLSC